MRQTGPAYAQVPPQSHRRSAAEARAWPLSRAWPERASERASERERERERLTQRRQRSAAAAQAWPLSRALGLRLRIFACPRAKSLGAGTSKPLGMLARISDGPGAARRQPVPLSHPFHINPASPSQPQTPINQTTQHRQARAHAHMRTRAPTRCVRAAPNQAMRTRAPAA